MLKEAWRGRKIFTTLYPVQGAQTSGTGKVVVDLIRQGVHDAIDTLMVHLTGTVVIAGTSAGTATGSYNPEGLLVNASLQLSPQVAGLTQINAISSRAAVIDRALQKGSFLFGTSIPNTAGNQTLEAWFYFTFKRENARRGIEYALPMNRWTSASLSLTLGTIDQLYSGSTNTWSFSNCSVEVWTNTQVDVFNSGGPPNIHASELFELIIPVTASNAALDINNLPQGCFYDELVFVAESGVVGNYGTLTDAIINNIDIEGGGRNWTVQGDSNAVFLRNEFTRPLFYDFGTTTNNALTGIYAFTLRDGLYSRAMDATSSPLDIKLNVTYPGTASQIRVLGRKLVPFGIRQTTDVAGAKKLIEKVPVLN